MPLKSRCTTSFCKEKPCTQSSLKTTTALKHGGPYDSFELAAEVIDAYVMRPSSARIVKAKEDMDYTGSPL